MSDRAWAWIFGTLAVINAIGTIVDCWQFWDRLRERKKKS